MLFKSLLVGSLACASALQINPSSVGRREMFAALAASPLVLPAVANAAEGAVPIWGMRKGTIEAPTSVTMGCKVDKPCKNGAAFPYSDVADKPRMGPGPAKKK